MYYLEAELHDCNGIIHVQMHDKVNNVQCKLKFSKGQLKIVSIVVVTEYIDGRYVVHRILEIQHGDALQPTESMHIIDHSFTLVSFNPIFYTGGGMSVH